MAESVASAVHRFDRDSLVIQGVAHCNDCGRAAGTPGCRHPIPVDVSLLSQMQARIAELETQQQQRARESLLLSTLLSRTSVTHTGDRYALLTGEEREVFERVRAEMRALRMEEAAV